MLSTPQTEVRRSLPNPRFFVPDLSPKDRLFLRNAKVRVVFVGESPHVNEIEEEKAELRRPLCGAAGKQWWSLLAEILEPGTQIDVSASWLMEFCLRHQLAVLNAVQYPLDPKITKAYPLAEPSKNLGFDKVSGPYSFKRLKNTSPVQQSIEALRTRLVHPSLQKALICPLGNDSEWFVTQALSKTDEGLSHLGEKIPHPSAWWRRGGFYGRVAKEKLSEIFKKPVQ